MFWRDPPQGDFPRHNVTRVHQARLAKEKNRKKSTGRFIWPRWKDGGPVNEKVSWPREIVASDKETC